MKEENKNLTGAQGAATGDRNAAETVQNGKNTRNAAETQIDAQIKAIMSGEADESAVRKTQRPKKRRKWRRLIVVLLLLCAALFTAYKLLGQKNETAPVVETAALSKGSVTETLTVTGPVEGTDSVDVTSNLHAKVTELNVREGDRVTAGETVLARLDTADLQKQIEVAQGNYDLAVAQKNEKIRADTESYQKAVQDLAAAQAEYNRQAALAQTGDVAQIELEKAQNALSDARRTASSFRVQNGKVLPDESMDIQISNAELALQQVKDKLEDAVILAPISGTVTRVNTKVGQFADDLQDNKPLITIENLDELQMEIKVSEYSIGKVRPGQAVRITADILGEGNFVNGEVASISPTGEEKGNGSTERVIPTRIKITDVNTALIAGITAKAQIVLEEAKDVWVVPISAVGDDGTGQAVMQFVAEDEASGRQMIRSLPVTTGTESDTDTEITGTLSDLGAALLSEGSLYLPTYNAMLADGTEVMTGAAGTEGAGEVGEAVSGAAAETDGGAAGAETEEETAPEQEAAENSAQAAEPEGAAS